VLPRTTSGGAAKIQPVCSHGKKITDFCSWRGLLVLGGVRTAARGDARVIGGAASAATAGSLTAPAPTVWAGDIDELWKLPRPTGRGGPWHETDVAAGVASEPYLMAGYDRKRLEVSHSDRDPVGVTVEVDPAGDGMWLTYATLTVPPGETVRHEFPAGYSAHWVRLIADRAGTATATFTYE
jgi:plastocyanin